MKWREKKKINNLNRKTNKQKERKQKNPHQKNQTKPKKNINTTTYSLSETFITETQYQYVLKEIVKIREKTLVRQEA